MPNVSLATDGLRVYSAYPLGSSYACVQRAGDISMTLSRLYHGDCQDILGLALADNSIDSCVTDPPYHLTTGKKGGSGEASVNLESPYGRARVTTGFMGMKWDGGDVAMRPETWAEVLRVLKPGGYLLAFGGTRTYHRLACAIEDAGFEIRDQIGWAFGSGFPKSHNGEWGGTALKPSHEPVVVASKAAPLLDTWRIIGSHTTSLWWTLWSMFDASDAQRFSALSPAECGVDMSASVLRLAEQQRSTRAALCDLMGTSRFVMALTSCLSTVASWSRTLAESSGLGSTSTIGTESGTTTDLRTLKFSLSRITPESIILAHKTGQWSSADACNAAKCSSAIVAALRATLELSAAERAIEQERTAYLDVGAIPSLEPICMARKPLIGTVAANVLKHGTGGLNIDGCRVATEARPNIVGGNGARKFTGDFKQGSREEGETLLGRWPANLIHDGSDEVLACFPQSAGQLADASTGADRRKTQNTRGAMARGNGREGQASADSENGGEVGFKMRPGARRGDTGSAARFFYCSKASRKDRSAHNLHPTVKPTDLMRYLCRLVTPKGGTVLDPFMGSGSTLKAAELEGFSAIGIELDPEYIAIAKRRIASDMPLFA